MTLLLLPLLFFPIFLVLLLFLFLLFFLLLLLFLVFCLLLLLFLFFSFSSSPSSSSASSSSSVSVFFFFVFFFFFIFFFFFFPSACSSWAAFSSRRLVAVLFFMSVSAEVETGIVANPRRTSRKRWLFPWQPQPKRVPAIACARRSFRYCSGSGCRNEVQQPLSEKLSLSRKMMLRSLL